MSSSNSNTNSVVHPHAELIQLISTAIYPLGYQVIHLELQTHRQKTLRIYIDYLEPSPDHVIGIEDCVRVSKALDLYLDQVSEMETAFPGGYELEVSSPGVDRPLRAPNDFQRFAGKKVRIHVYRPMSGEEIGNPTHHEKNPRQKNFIGTLVGLQEGKVVLAISSQDLGSKQFKKKGKAKPSIEDTELDHQVMIPLPLISKANLEPDFQFEASEKESRQL